MRVIQCGSRSLSDCETRYATVELEMLGIVFAIEKCDFYLRGIKHFHIQTDHKPLIGLMKKELHDIPNDRLVRMRERLIPYHFTTSWVEGKLNVIADALSRSPVSKAEQNAHERRHDILTCQFLSQLAPCNELVQAGLEDKEYCTLIRLIEQGVGHKNVPGDLQTFKPSWEKLSLLGGPTQKLVIYNGSRIVVPQKCRRDILLKLHSSHCGQSKMLEYAQQLYFWPGMTLDVRQLVDTCDSCQELRPSKPLEPTSEQTIPLAPMSHVSVDLFQSAGVTYVVMVDRFSGWPFYSPLIKTDTGAVVNKLKSWFEIFGFPLAIRTDGGPQFRNEFKSFCRTNGIAHELSSAYNPTSNGHAESAVKNIKHMIIKCKKSKTHISTALAHFRNTPRQDGVSPAQLFLQRRIRINLPVLSKHLAPMNSELMGEALTQRNSALQKSRSTRDQKCKPLALLEPGEKVLVQSDSTKLWDTKGIIVSRREDGRSYNVKNSDGSIQLRNRRHLWPVQGGEIDLPALRQSHPGLHTVHNTEEAPESPVTQVNCVTWEPLIPRKMDPKKSQETSSKGGKREARTCSNSTDRRPSSPSCAAWSSSQQPASSTSCGRPITGTSGSSKAGTTSSCLCTGKRAATGSSTPPTPMTTGTFSCQCGQAHPKADLGIARCPCTWNCLGSRSYQALCHGLRSDESLLQYLEDLVVSFRRRTPLPAPLTNQVQLYDTSAPGAAMTEDDVAFLVVEEPRQESTRGSRSRRFTRGRPNKWRPHKAPKDWRHQADLIVPQEVHENVESIRTSRTPRYYDPRRNPRKGEDFATYHRRMRRLTTAGVKTTESQHYRDYLNLKIEVLDDMDHPYIGPCTADLAEQKSQEEDKDEDKEEDQPAATKEDNPMPVLMDTEAEAQVCKNIVNSILKQTGCRGMIAKADIAELDQIKGTLVALLESMANRNVLFDDKDDLTPELVLDFGFPIQLVYSSPVPGCTPVECSSLISPGEKWNKGAPKDAYDYGFRILAKGATYFPMSIPLTRHEHVADGASSTPEQTEEVPK